jgi:hypothetical protein
MAIISNDFTPKNPYNFHCEFCDFNTCNKKDFNRHIDTMKHIRNKKQGIINKNTQKNPKLECSRCGKNYKNNSGLWRHSKTCNTAINDCLTDKELILKILKQNTELIKENSEFKLLMLEQNKSMNELVTMPYHTTNNNSNNTNNFNINVYLNETCKNAMNIMDFVGQLKVGVEDLEETSRLGYAEGISKIFINGLKQMNVTDRPIHCSNGKKETLYIKDNNEWNKETTDRVILTNAIKHVANKNIKQISEWTKMHPDYNNSKSKTNDKYLKIVSNSMNGLTEEESKKNINKIISNVAKETVIKKEA